MTILCVPYPERQHHQQQQRRRHRVRQKTIAKHEVVNDNNNNSTSTGIPYQQQQQQQRRRIKILLWYFIIWFTTTCGLMVIISLMIGYYMISLSDQDSNNNNHYYYHHRIHSIQQHPFRRQQSQHDDRPSTTIHLQTTPSPLENDDDDDDDNENHPKPKEEEKERILYIVTSIAEYDNGLRSTIEGNDRFTNTLVPVLLESVQSILSTGTTTTTTVGSTTPSFNYNNPNKNQTILKLYHHYFSVDVYLITHYPITRQRYQQLRSQLPSSVGLQIWDMATPYGYMQDTSWKDAKQSQEQQKQQQQQQQDNRLQYHTRGLSRQHRYVIKDKLYYYDYFINVEDDMLIHYDQVQHYIQMSNSIYQLRHHHHHHRQQQQQEQQQPKHPAILKSYNMTKNNHTVDPSLQFYGPMTEHQLGRTIPGFIRVEVVLMDDNNNNNNKMKKKNDDDNNNNNRILTLPTLKTQKHPLLEYFQHHPIPKNRKMYYNIPMDYTWENNHSNNNNNTTTSLSSSSSSSSSLETEFEIDASICCHVTNHTWQQQLRSRNDQNNKNPSLSSIIPPTLLLHTTTTTPLITAHDLYFWEMNIESLGVRRMPTMNIPSLHHITDNITTTTTTTNHLLNDLDWVMLLGGSNNELFQKINDPSYIIGDYWSGQYLIDTTSTTTTTTNHKTMERPDRRNGKYVNNQGGWFGTRRQIIEWHTRWCRGSFLPPYDLPTYRLDGLDGRSVEYWSGGIQLVGINACNLQRIVALRPEYFSKHLLYHTSNNKQRSNTVQYRFSRHSIQEFWGQINTVRKHAERIMNKELGLLH